MAKKTQPVEEPKEEVVDYKEVHETDIKDIIGAPETEEHETVEEPKIEEKPEEKEFDPDKFKEEITKDLEAKIAESNKQEVVEAKGDDELISPWAKEGRTPKDYEEVADWGIQKARVLSEREEAHKAELQAEETKKAEEYNLKQIENFNKYTDMQLQDLKEAGKITTPDERKELFQTMLDVNTARQKENKPPVTSIKEIFYEHYKPVKNQQPAGADAPVSSAKQSGISSDEKEVNYIKDVRNKSLIDILMGK